MLTYNKISLQNQIDNFVFDQCNNSKNKDDIKVVIAELTNYSQKYIEFLTKAIFTKIEDMNSFQFKRVELFIYKYWDNRFITERSINAEIESFSDYLAKK